MMTAVLRQPGYRRLWAATTIDALGSWLLVMAVPLQVFKLTGSAISTGLALAVQAVPAVTIGPWAGVAVDRWRRRNVLMTANLFAMAGVSLMVLATVPARTGFLFAGLFAESAAVCFLRPALRAVTPMVVHSEADLAAANSLAAFNDAVLRLTGPLAGTFLAARGWFDVLVITDAATYGIAAAIVAGIAVGDSPARRSAGAGRQIRDGLRHVLVTPLLRGLLASSWAFWTGNAALTALLVPFTATRLHSSGQALGYLIAGLGIGYLAGSMISGRVILRHTTRTIVSVAYTSVGLCFFVMVNATTLPVAVAAATAAGVPGVVALTAIGHRLQADTPNAILGRVSATFFTSDAMAALAGALVATAVVDVVNLDTALHIFSALVLLTGPLAAVVVPGPTR
ncbi:MFS transporter [Actinoplanes sp. CA-142083]|uniref:MFS transporter n=1 Tax=Actinoplanes sp. CA-142083 TaxID=3239903 RepID=UPI003D8A2FDE